MWLEQQNGGHGAHFLLAQRLNSLQALRCWRRSAYGAAAPPIRSTEPPEPPSAFLRAVRALPRRMFDRPVCVCNALDTFEVRSKLNLILVLRIGRSPCECKGMVQCGGFSLGCMAMSGQMYGKCPPVRERAFDSPQSDPEIAMLHSNKNGVGPLCKRSGQCFAWTRIDLKNIQSGSARASGGRCARLPYRFRSCAACPVQRSADPRRL